MRKVYKNTPGEDTAVFFYNNYLEYQGNLVMGEKLLKDEEFLDNILLLARMTPQEKCRLEIQ